MDLALLHFRVARGRQLLRGIPRRFLQNPGRKHPCPLSHSGDKGLTTHLSNCVVKQSAAGVMVAKEHPHSPRKIDLAVAAILAHDRATRSVERAPFEMVWLS